jgi:ubiquinone/menaquinone biosynthesis C-methylase UbiE
LNEDNDILDELKDSSRKTFEHLYVVLREKEKRIYTDEEVLRLPFTESTHPHYSEWEFRKQSASGLLNYLRKKGTNLTILEIGCGNGWLSGKLGDIPRSTITGIDINHSELNQAKRVFRNKTNIHFIPWDIGQIPSEMAFDIIIFAASIQYFRSFRLTINNILFHLNPGGEIHVLDSPFYPEAEIVQAQQRSENYYRNIGYPELAHFYFHHSAESLVYFNHSFLFNPWRPVNKILRRKNPFPWICIKA